MAIKIDCPRCAKPLQLPDKAAGGYVNCTHCKGRLWVPNDAPVPAETSATGTSTPAVSKEPSLATTNHPVARSAGPTTNPPSVSQTPPALIPIQTSVPAKRVARFIATEAADSTLKLAADGKLPELRLEEGRTKEKPEAADRSINPLVMLGVLSISVVLSVVLVLMDTDSPPTSGVGQKAAMRQRLADHYFGLGDLRAKPLEPYQVLLREAQQAYSHGDYKTQRENYRKVLDMLRAERGGEDRGLTGSRSKDKELEEALLVLLSGG